MYAASRSTGFGAEVIRRIMLGTYVLSAGYYDAYYMKAQQVRTLIRRDFEAAFAAVDVVATPTAPTGAFPLGSLNNDPLQMAGVAQPLRRAAARGERQEQQQHPHHRSRHRQPGDEHQHFADELVDQQQCESAEHAGGILR
jgi:hypothetical protein